MSASARDEIRRQLHGVVASVSGDASIRHRLQVAPRAVLRDVGLPWDDVPDRLLPASDPVSVWLDEATVFGGVSTAPEVPPCESAEVLLWSAGAKPMLLFHAPERQAAALAAWTRARGATALLSPHEFEPARAPATGNYSNRAATTRPALAGSGAWRGVIVAREPVRAMLAWLSLLFHWDEFLGRLLGYPACCSAAFAACWPDALHEHEGDVAALLVRRHAPAGFLGTYGCGTNVFARYFGVELLQHFPCRLDCKASHALARRYAAALEVFDAVRGKQVREVLTSAALFTDRDGVALFPGARVARHGASVALEFNPDAVLFTDPAGALPQQLSSGRMTATASSISVDDRRIDGWLADFAPYAQATGESNVDADVTRDLPDAMEVGHR